MGLPQWIMIVLLTLSLGISQSQHGQPRTGKENFFISLLGTAITLALLIWGGFFTK